MHSGIVSSLSTSSFDKIKVMSGPKSVLSPMMWAYLHGTLFSGLADLGRGSNRGQEAGSMNVHQMAAQPTLRMALGDYPHTAALKNKEIKSDRVALDFADI